MIQATNQEGFYKIERKKLDIESMGHFEKEWNSFVSPFDQNIFLDLSEVEEISSAILGILLHKRMKMRKLGVEIHLLNVNPKILRILKIMNLSCYFLFQHTKAKQANFSTLYGQGTLVLPD
ncbi:STAS domain-containing protein [Leptospira ilyithenensis]|uniref:Anti-sigma factor antagonist n=1 Tax=Leptospira ilyithenensis TaxID=2484901 RepID=A0A4R9LT34_9LEPT|nr:STAS domain-containing protein [Leptospira ilyithenensis]TGN11805.1 anti-sigma factor antagonist [Leptospira ilyithenensis]